MRRGAPGDPPWGLQTFSRLRRKAGAHVMTQHNAADECCNLESPRHMLCTTARFWVLTQVGV